MLVVTRITEGIDPPLDLMDHPRGGELVSDEPAIEADFLKSKTNQTKQKAAFRFVTRDPHYRVADLATKRRLIELLPTGEWGIQTFDLIRVRDPNVELTAATVDHFLDDLLLVEVKATQKPIRNAALNGFFFGTTKRERAMAEALPDKYRFLFVVLNPINDYKRPFAVLLSLQEVDEATRQWRVQYQVNFRNDLAERPREELLQDGRLIF